MKTFKGLLWKDYYISRMWFIGWIGIITFLYAVGVGVGKYFEESGFIFLFVVMLGFMQLAFLPIILIAMLRLEGRTQLWLHTPLNCWKLLLSKFFIAFIYSLVSFLCVDLLGVLSLSLKWITLPYIPWKESIWFNLFIISMAVHLGSWILFYWTFYHSLSKYPRLKNVRWVLIVIIYIVYQFGTAILMKYKWVNDILNVWTIKIPSGMFFEIGPEGNQFRVNEEYLHFPLLTLIIYIVLTIFLFALSSWLLERKVEV
ncbi:hypothetical protein JOC86_001334 [Bacillus pakistanensis]|uniref:Uncharacterized protein n=1 Tax=Rossellomorea pakistanensis TaxID=992288 RepID=A0ABS2NAB7_9BACI|nr:hypothetical protein [Bacillus pakistanensis]MBM7584797.1 hypothetical protein [Bacillus pakistanensis]